MEWNILCIHNMNRKMVDWRTAWRTDTTYHNTSLPLALKGAEILSNSIANNSIHLITLFPIPDTFVEVLHTHYTFNYYLLRLTATTNILIMKFQFLLLVPFPFRYSWFPLEQILPIYFYVLKRHYRVNWLV